MTTRKITALVIMGALIAALSATTAFADYKTTLTLTLKGGSAVPNPTYDETYTLSVPESLRIANTGWNSMGSMTVKYSGSNTGFNTAKKLVVTASSTNSFKLVADGGGSISYFLATGENDTSATTSFTFTAAQITAGAEQTLGVNIGSFTGASDGTYTDEITYTVAIEDVGTASLAGMLTEGTVTTVAVIIGSDTVTATLIRTSTGFTITSDNASYSSVSTQVTDNYVAVIFSDESSVTLFTNNNTYSVTDGTTLTSITVGGTDITSTLTGQQKG